MYQLIPEVAWSRQSQSETFFFRCYSFLLKSGFLISPCYISSQDFSKTIEWENQQVLLCNFPYFSVSICAYWKLLIDEWGLYQAWQESLCLRFSLKYICHATQNWIASLGFNQRHGTDLRHSEGNEWLMQFIDKIALLLSHVLFVCNLQWFKFRWS